MGGDDVTVITPAIRERLHPNSDGEVLSGTAMRSVAAQTVLPKAHLVRVDYAKEGLAANRNALIAQVETEWFVPLDDDDILQKNFLERLLPHARGADVVYSRVHVHGSDWAPYRYSFDAKDLRRENYIPATALIRKSLWERLGGYRNVRLEDWDFWLRALDAGAQFRHVQESLWIYRFHDGNTLHPDVEVVPSAASPETAGLVLHRPSALQPNSAQPAIT